MIYRVRKNNKILKGVIRLTPSKSISNRLLVIRALCKESFEITNLATAKDTAILEKLLNSSGGILDAEDAGTTFRFLAAFLSQKNGEWLLTGTSRMKQRPIGILVQALRKLGADISYTEKENFPPLKINGKLLKGGEIEIDGSVSSQFITALLMVAPVLEKGLRLKITGEVSSQPYMEMTLKLMQSFGIRYEQKGKMISIARQNYKAKNCRVETDWSAASYWYEMAALSSEVDLTLEGLVKESIQGDAVIAEIMKLAGVDTEFTERGVKLTKRSGVRMQKLSYNFLSCPDLVPAMAVTCAALGAGADFKGVQNLRIKETDRLAALRTELGKTGTPVLISNFGMQIPEYGEMNHPSSFFKTYDDHRMAMAFAPLAIKYGEVEIENPEAVNKSYPEFWEDLKTVGFEVA